MIKIDRSAPIPPFEQLVGQLRLEIMSGQHKSGVLLPSTRALGAQLNLSFHTVSRAYKRLVEDGLIRSEPGRGFRVCDRPSVPKGERMENGAAIVQDALRQLAAIGLTEQEIDYTLQEQMAYFDAAPSERKVIFAAPFLELAEIVADQLADVLQEDVLPITLSQLSSHLDADLAFSPVRYVLSASDHLDPVPVRGLLIHFPPEVLEPIARLMPHETLGVVTNYPDSITPVLSELKAQTSFRSQVVATALDVPERSVYDLVRQVDLLAYTPGCHRRVKRVAREVRHVVLRWTISPLSIEAVRSL